MHYQQSKTADPYIIRLDRGEKVVSSLTAFCLEHDIKAATISAIGAVDQLTCGYYDLASKKYHFTDYTEPLEVVSLTGYVTEKDDAPHLHLHGVFSDTKNLARGGHVVEMTVGVVLEVTLTPLDKPIVRIHDDCTGLALMTFTELS